MTSLRRILRTPIMPETDDVPEITHEPSVDPEVRNLSYNAINAEDGMALEQSVATMDEIVGKGIVVAGLAEDLIDVAEKEELTDSSVSLIKLASELVCIETDLSSGEDLIPGLESAIGQVVTLESFRERLADFWEKLMSLVVKIYDKFLLFIDNARTQAESAAARADILLERLNRLKGREPKPKVDLGEQTRRVLLAGKALSARNFTLQLKKTVDQSQRLLIANTDFTLQLAKKTYPRIESTLSLIDKGDEQGLDLAADKLRFIAEQGHLVRRRFDSPQDYFLTNTVSRSELSIVESEPLLGDRVLEGRLRSYDPSMIRSAIGLNLLKIVDAIYGSEVGLRNTEQYIDKLPSLETLSPDQMRSVLQYSKEIAGTVARFKLRYDSQLRSIRNDFKLLRNKSRSLARQGENDQLKWYVRRSGNAAHGFTRWLHTPAIPYMTHALRVISASLTYVERSITAHR